MKAQIIIIGDELLNGRITDLNGPFLANWLFCQGIELEKTLIIRDQEEPLMQALTDAWENVDLILTTGGLGPTQDDLTKTLLARFFQKDLHENEYAKSLVLKHYERINKEWTPAHNGYHILPEDFFPVENGNGLAPGLGYFCGENRKLLLAAPGVPRELVAMTNEQWTHIIHDKLAPNLEDQQQVVIRTRNIPEEHLFVELATQLWEDLEKFGKVSSLPQIMGVDILITFRSSHEEYENRLTQIKSIVEKTPIAPNIWQWGNLSVEEFVIKRAKEKGIKIALAESCTGGLSAHRLTNVSGSSSVFMGSAVTYSNEAKESILGVQSESLKSFGAVSDQVAMEMAKGALEKYSADIAISHTGIAGPTGGSKEKPVGTVSIGIATAKENKAKTYQFRGDRERLKWRFSEKGFFSLLGEIEKL